MIPRLDLNQEERASVVARLVEYLNDKSNIVKTFSMQALADLAEKDTTVRVKVIPLLEELTRAGSPAMRSRGRKLVQRLTNVVS